MWIESFSAQEDEKSINKFIEIPDGNKATWETSFEGEIILKWI
jgi:hypothetical protein